MQNACYEICGCVISVFEGKVFDLLSQGSIFEAFAELGRQVRHPYFEAFAVQDEGLNLSSIREDEQVRNNLLYLKRGVSALSDMAQQNKISLDITPFIRRAYLLPRRLHYVPWISSLA